MLHLHCDILSKAHLFFDSSSSFFCYFFVHHISRIIQNSHFSFLEHALMLGWQAGEAHLISAHRLAFDFWQHQIARTNALILFDVIDTFILFDGISILVLFDAHLPFRRDRRSNAFMCGHLGYLIFQ